MKACGKTTSVMAGVGRRADMGISTKELGRTMFRKVLERFWRSKLGVSIKASG
jgi:hypothetical protein